MGLLDYLKKVCKQIKDMAIYARYISRKNDHANLIDNNSNNNRDGGCSDNNLEVKNVYHEGSFCVLLYDEINMIEP